MKLHYVSHVNVITEDELGNHKKTLYQVKTKQIIDQYFISSFVLSYIIKNMECDPNISVETRFTKNHMRHAIAHFFNGVSLSVIKRVNGSPFIQKLKIYTEAYIQCGIHTNAKSVINIEYDPLLILDNFSFNRCRVHIKGSIYTIGMKDLYNDVGLNKDSIVYEVNFRYKYDNIYALTQDYQKDFTLYLIKHSKDKDFSIIPDLISSTDHEKKMINHFLSYKSVLKLLKLNFKEFLSKEKSQK